MMALTAPLLSDAERTVLARLADIIAPAWQAMPSATDIKLSGTPIDRALEARPDLVLPLKKLLAEFAGAGPLMTIQQLSRERPEDLTNLIQAVAGAYYMHARVRDALGYTGQRRLAPPAKP